MQHEFVLTELKYRSPQQHACMRQKGIAEKKQYCGLCRVITQVDKNIKLHSETLCTEVPVP